MSLWSPVGTSELDRGAAREVEEALGALMGRGAAVVVAAGNQRGYGLGGEPACGGYPANVPGAVTVGAVDRGGARWSKSNWGACVDVHAPGVGILGADAASPGGRAARTGSSQAAPLVAGLVAAYLSTSPGAGAGAVWGQVVAAAAEGLVADDRDGSRHTLFPEGHAGESGWTDISATPNRLARALRPNPVRASPTHVVIRPEDGGEFPVAVRVDPGAAGGAGGALLSVSFRAGAADPVSLGPVPFERVDGGLEARVTVAVARGAARGPPGRTVPVTVWVGGAEAVPGEMSAEVAVLDMRK